MGVDCEEVDASRVDSGHDEVGTDIALVLEEVLLEQRHARYDAGLPASGEGVQLELG